MNETTLDNLIKEWTNGKLGLFDEVSYPDEVYIDFSLGSLNPIDSQNLKDDFKTKYFIDFDFKRVAYYRLLPVKIVGATLVFGEGKQLQIEGKGWATDVSVAELLEKPSLKDYQNSQNIIVNQFLKRLNKYNANQTEEVEK
ncbi:hypothetical protein [Oenococcus sicerae]|uniref:Uncharacterized protein n=1 Tax=Oenococcus sicerae TaxID=2203724 RepID=A0AAJ1R885_9LACO|nr:hypothetical protein [Oenococcus sicerae]MDN6899551.1 hypothetical protein [Oenococcus sicerae]